MSLSKHDFYIVDVFAERKYAGNPLAVVICPGPLPAPDMQSIAREMNYSETTFLQPQPDADGSYQVRIFTPNSELPFAGHPCLGTAWIIRHLYSPDAQEITLKVPAGNIPVTFASDGVLWMEQLQPTFGSLVSASAAAAVIGLETEEIDERYPAQVVSTGIPILLIPVKTLASVRSAVYRSEAAAALPAEAAVPVMPFCPETYDKAKSCPGLSSIKKTISGLLQAEMVFLMGCSGRPPLNPGAASRSSPARPSRTASSCTRERRAFEANPCFLLFSGRKA